MGISLLNCIQRRFICAGGVAQAEALSSSSSTSKKKKRKKKYICIEFCSQALLAHALVTQEANIKTIMV
jgi:hypothetical protein